MTPGLSSSLSSIGRLLSIIRKMSTSGSYVTFTASSSIYLSCLSDKLLLRWPDRHRRRQLRVVERFYHNRSQAVIDRPFSHLPQQRSVVVVAVLSQAALVE